MPKPIQSQDPKPQVLPSALAVKTNEIVAIIGDNPIVPNRAFDAVINRTLLRSVLSRLGYELTSKSNTLYWVKQSHQLPQAKKHKKAKRGTK